MTPRMKAFLTDAADALPGKGVPVRKEDKQIAAKAVSDGYGMMLTFIFTVFIINDAGREAIASDAAAAE